MDRNFRYVHVMLSFFFFPIDSVKFFYLDFRFVKRMWIDVLKSYGLRRVLCWFGNADRIVGKSSRYLVSDSMFWNRDSVVFFITRWNRMRLVGSNDYQYCWSDVGCRCNRQELFIDRGRSLKSPTCSGGIVWAVQASCLIGDEKSLSPVEGENLLKQSGVQIFPFH